MGMTLAKTMTFKLVGIGHQSGAREMLMRMTDGVGVTIVREPHNRFDRRAIAVQYQHQKLGYIKADDNGPISRWMDDNGKREYPATFISKGEMIKVELPL